MLVRVPAEQKRNPVDSSKFAMTAHKLEDFQVLENERTKLLKQRLQKSSAERSNAQSFVACILEEEILPGGGGRLDAMLLGLEKKAWELRSWRVVGFAGSDSDESHVIEPSSMPGKNEVVSFYTEARAQRVVDLTATDTLLHNHRCI